MKQNCVHMESHYGKSESVYIWRLFTLTSKIKRQSSVVSNTRIFYLRALGAFSQLIYIHVSSLYSTTITF